MMKRGWISGAWLLAAIAGAASSADKGAAPPTGPALAPLAAMLETAMTAYDSGDYERARPAFRGLADHGSAIAETMLGVMYARGQGVAADPATAAAYWLRAASRGYPPAQLALARAFVTGAGIGRDPGAAWLWASLAARGGDVAVAPRANALATQLRRGFTAEQAATLAKRLAGWRPWVAAG